MVDVRGSRGNDVMIGPKYGGATFYGGEGMMCCGRSPQRQLAPLLLRRGGE
jgi:hypothetical protein